MLKIIISLVATTVLVGCVGLNNKADCPGKPGVFCKSVGEVNTLVDKGLLPKDEECPEGQCKKVGITKIVKKEAAIKTTQPIRVPEAILKIWIAPFEDKNGVHHTDSYLTAVVREAHWSEG